MLELPSWWLDAAIVIAIVVLFGTFGYVMIVQPKRMIAEPDEAEWPEYDGLCERADAEEAEVAIYNANPEPQQLLEPAIADASADPLIHRPPPVVPQATPIVTYGKGVDNKVPIRQESLEELAEHSQHFKEKLAEQEAEKHRQERAEHAMRVQKERAFARRIEGGLPDDDGHGGSGHHD